MKDLTLRDLLLNLGIGNFNATMIIQSMFQSPAATDPRSPAILLLVRQIQRTLQAMGAPIRETGMLNLETAAQLQRLMGTGWLNKTWAQVVQGVVAARDARVSLAPMATAPQSSPAPVSGLAGFLDFLPSVPGGLITYAIGGLVAYHYFTKKH